jgi:hypothetical protein
LDTDGFNFSRFIALLFMIFYLNTDARLTSISITQVKWFRVQGSRFSNASILT